MILVSSRVNRITSLGAGCKVESMFNIGIRPEGNINKGQNLIYYQCITIMLAKYMSREGNKLSKSYLRWNSSYLGMLNLCLATGPEFY